MNLYCLIAGGTTQSLAMQPIVRRMLQDGDDGSVLWTGSSLLLAFYCISAIRG